MISDEDENAQQMLTNLTYVIKLQTFKRHLMVSDEDVMH